jgi:tetratricopeptide (TPR) repeat protein
MQWAFLKRYSVLIGIVVLLFIIVGLIYLRGDPVGQIFSAYASRGYTLTQKLLTESRVVVLYISLLFFPRPDRLNLDYDFPVSESLLAPATTFFSLLFLAGLLVLAVLAARKNRLLSFAILWFLGNLVIESSFIPLELVFEHRIYLPSMFVVLLLVMTLYRILKSHKYLLYTVCIVTLTLLPYWTFERNRVWADELTLWQDCLQKSPNKWRVHNNIGKEYFRRWETDKAIHHYQMALQFNNTDILVRMNLASALAMQERYQEAIIQLQIVLNIDPGNQKAWEHLQANKRFLKWQKSD